MSANLFGERVLSLREPMWHALGIVSEKEQSAAEALKAIGSYEVYLEDLNTASGMPVDYRAIVREAVSDDPHERVFGVVSNDYTLIDPPTAAVLWDLAVKLPVETIGAIGWGEILFITSRLHDFDVLGDPIQTYLLLKSPMTGRASATVHLTPVRVVCQNTLETATRMSTEVHRIRHDADAIEELYGWLSDVVERVEAKASALKEVFEIFASTPILSPSNVVTKIFPDPVEPSQKLSQDEYALAVDVYVREMSRVVGQRSAVTQLYEGGATGLERFGGTAWALYNSVVEYADWMGGATYKGALWGEGARMKSRAFETIRETIKA